MWLELGSCFSRFINVLVFRGDADISTSARAHIEKWARLEPFIDGIFTKGHCRRAWIVERFRAEEMSKL